MTNEPKEVGDIATEIEARFAAMAERCRAIEVSVDLEIASTPIPECEDHGLPMPFDRAASLSATARACEMTLVRGKCPACEEANKKAKAVAYARSLGVPDRLAFASIESWVAETEAQKTVIAKVMRWKEDCLVLHGNNGTGKSHIAAAFVLRDHRNIFTTHADLIARVRSGYEDNSATDKIRVLSSCPILAVDEIGVSSGGGDTESILYSVFSGRYNARLRTIITTNLSPTEIARVLGKAITDRMAESVLSLHFDWKSHRRRRECRYT